ncbi:MAG: hypothetical protein IT353_00565 [Gemmatimonadaceae bacterium]|nr:hypothetical protein [Gemmatimonadaceae bacterium]
MTMGPIDVNSWIGGYPFRDLPHPTPDILAGVLDREGYGGAWVGHLPGAFHRDPVPSNRELYRALAPYRERLWPSPMVRPDWPDWEGQLRTAVDEGAPSVRVYPAQWGLGHAALYELSHACREASIALHITVRFEDLRQRHAMDSVGDVSAALLRGVARQGGAGVMLVSGAGRELIEETHWGLTPDEQSRVFYDFHWVWGPPEDQFSHLVRTLGPQRLAWSMWWPLRLVQQSRALVDLLEFEDVQRVSSEPLADGAMIAARAQQLLGTA